MRVKRFLMRYPLVLEQIITWNLFVACLKNYFWVKYIIPWRNYTEIPLRMLIFRNISLPFFKLFAMYINSNIFNICVVQILIQIFTLLFFILSLKLSDKFLILHLIMCVYNFILIPENICFCSYLDILWGLTSLDTIQLYWIM